MTIVAEFATSKRPLLIRGAGVVTLDPALGEFAEADILIRDGAIAAISPTLDVPDAEPIDARAMIAMPGFVDGHRHLWEGMIRGTLPTEDLPGYLRLVNNGFARAYTPDDVYLGTLVSALGALDAGITTVFDWSHIQTTPGHTEAAIAALREAGIRAVFGFGPPGRDDQGHRWPHDLLRLQRDEFSSSDQLLTLALASASPEHVPDEVAKAHFRLARDAGLIISVHAGIEGMGRPNEIERFGREGLLDRNVNLVHCNTLSPGEWRIIAESGASVCITPSVEMQMGHGIPPIQPALDVGVKPSLGIDVETSTPSDMWTQMRTAYALQRSNAFALQHAGREAPAMIDCAEILHLGTMAGAASARLEGKVGSLSIGKQADIVLLRADLLNCMPVNDLKSAVLLNMDARNVDTVLVAGRVVKRGGQMVGVDMAQFAARLYDRRDRMFHSAGIVYPSPSHRIGNDGHGLAAS